MTFTQRFHFQVALVCIVSYFACLIDQFVSPFLMAVIRRAPHEFKIACLEVNIKGQTLLLDIY